MELAPYTSKMVRLWASAPELVSDGLLGYKSLWVVIISHNTTRAGPARLWPRPDSGMDMK
jgi:hypothetical protein